MNLSTKMIHRDTSDGLACGKQYPVACDFVQEPGPDAQMCTRCQRKL